MSTGENLQHKLDGILHSFFSSNSNYHHLRSFDTLLSTYIPRIVKHYGSLTTLLGNRKFTISIDNATAHADQTTPEDCFRFGLNYTCSIFANISLSCDDENIPSLSVRTNIARLPLMTGKTVLSSALDHQESVIEPIDGAFIVRGKLRTVPCTKVPLFNFGIVVEKKSVFACQVRSTHFDKIFRSTSTIEFTIEKLPKKSINCGVIGVKLPFQQSVIHVQVLAQAFGASANEFIELVKCIAGTKYDDRNFRSYEISMENHKYTNVVNSVESATALIAKLFGKGVISTGKGILKNETFPHVRDENAEQENHQKLLFLACIVSKLILTRHGLLESTRRDDYAYSRTITAANHIGSLFRLLFIQHVRTCGKLLRRALMKNGGVSTTETNPMKSLDLAKIYGEQRLSARIMSAVASGIWSVLRKGVALALNSNNRDAISLQLRRISSNLSTTDGSHTLPRAVASDQYGFVCAAYTPDGESTGLVYEMAALATLSPAVIDVGKTLSKVIERRLNDILMPIAEYLAKPFVLNENQSFYYNCMYIITHVCMDCKNFVNRFRQLRRNMQISIFAFVSRFPKRCEIRVQCEEGIICFPAIVAERYDEITLSDTFQSALSKGIVEYVSPQEASTICSFAVNREEYVPDKTTHIHLTEASFMGLNAGSVVFATSEQGPRLSYFTSQLKQIISSSISLRRGAIARNSLWHAHRSLVQTKMQIMRQGSDDLRGVPCVLAFMPFDSNQEDALVIKKSFIERGGLAASTMRVYVSEAANPNSLLSETFEKPEFVLSKKTANYDALAENGLPTIGKQVQGGDVIIGKTRSLRKIIAGSSTKYDCNKPGQKNVRRTQRQIITRRDISTTCLKDEKGTISHVSTSSVPNGQRVCVELTTSREVKVGDKLTTSAAQKGVVGAIISEEDLPFSMSTGCAPDVIASPLSLTSRMTMSSLLESITGKVVAVTGDLENGVDNQEFSKSNKIHAEKMGKLLAKHGFNRNGTEQFIDGRTGEIIEGHVFVGIISYFRLLHLAEKKLHSRGKGPRDPLTRTARDGRRFGGGLRIGEMESAGLASHGVATTLQQRFREFSDVFIVHVCKKCHLLCDDCNTKIQFYYCRRCRTNETVRAIEIPFTLLICSLELLSTGVTITFKTTDDDEENNGGQVLLDIEDSFIDANNEIIYA
jgi:DNA-directed RNA polymerase beta subunit